MKKEGHRLDELTDEEARARVHKSKAMLEAEHQAKQALSEGEAKKLSLDEEINRNMEDVAVISKVNEQIQAKNCLRRTSDIVHIALLSIATTGCSGNRLLISPVYAFFPRFRFLNVYLIFVTCTS